MNPAYFLDKYEFARDGKSLCGQWDQESEIKRSAKDAKFLVIIDWFVEWFEFDTNELEETLPYYK